MRIAAVLLVIMTAVSGLAPRQAPSVHFDVVDIGHRVSLHYAEQGAGVPVIFIHGSLSDMGYWKDEVTAFAKNYRALAYSRRYNPPNNNPSVPGYSAIMDADDLIGMIRKLKLGRVYIVGHSYGALTALYAAVLHPELIRAMVLAEPPAIPLLLDVEGSDHARAVEMYTNMAHRMIEPMRRDFRAGRREAGVADFINYVLDDSRAWTSKFTPEARTDTMADAHEWDVMMTEGTLFPPISAQQVASVRVPTLVMSGGKSYRFLALIDRYLATHIPNAQSVTYANAGHQMWYQDAEQARSATEAFFAEHP